MDDMSVTGIYRIYEDGILVAQTENLITTLGKKEILGILAGKSPLISRIGLGVGTTAAAVGDLALEFPLVDTPVEFVAPLFDGASSKIVYKSRLSEGVSGVINEIGCYNSTSTNSLMADFEPDSGGGVGLAGAGVEDIRVGRTAPLLDSGTPITTTNVFSPGDARLTDNIALAIKPVGATGGVVTVTLTDTSGKTALYAYTVASNSNYQILKQPLSAWTIQAGFDWFSLQSATAARTSGTNTYYVDGLATISTQRSGVLISRAIYPSAVVKKLGVRLDIEYELGINLA
jgi:hypothetical protein